MTMSSRLLAFLCFGTPIVAAMVGGDAWADSALPPVIGPKKVCLKYSNFDLLDGEQVTNSAGGVEGVSLQISGRAGKFSVGESEIYAEPARRGTLVASLDGTKIYRLSDASGAIFYALYGHAESLGVRDRKILVLSGPAFTGGATDAASYSRFRIGDPGAVKCGHSYVYGWDYLVPD